MHSFQVQGYTVVIRNFLTTHVLACAYVSTTLVIVTYPMMYKIAAHVSRSARTGFTQKSQLSEHYTTGNND